MTNTKDKEFIFSSKVPGVEFYTYGIITSRDTSSFTLEELHTIVHEVRTERRATSWAFVDAVNLVKQVAILAHVPVSEAMSALAADTGYSKNNLLADCRVAVCVPADLRRILTVSIARQVGSVCGWNTDRLRALVDKHPDAMRNATALADLIRGRRVDDQGCLVEDAKRMSRVKSFNKTKKKNREARLKAALQRDGACLINVKAKLRLVYDWLTDLDISSLSLHDSSELAKLLKELRDTTKNRIGAVAD